MSSFEEIGFFSAETERNVAAIRSQNASLYTELDAEIRKAFEILGSGYSPQSLADAAGLLHFVRCIEACQATAILAERGVSSASFSVLRTAFECLFMACALWRKPEMLERHEKTHDTERILQAKEMLRIADKHLITGPSRALLEEVATEQSPGDKLSVFDSAAAADLLDLYQIIWRGSALAGAHATVRSMDNYCFEQPDGSFLLDLKPNYERVDFFLGLVMTCLRTAFARYQELLDRED